MLNKEVCWSCPRRRSILSNILSESWYCHKASKKARVAKLLSVENENPPDNCQRKLEHMVMGDKQGTIGENPR